MYLSKDSRQEESVVGKSYAGRQKIIYGTLWFYAGRQQLRVPRFTTVLVFTRALGGELLAQQDADKHKPQSNHEKRTCFGKRGEILK